MLAQPPFWLILVAFLCVIGPLVILHELGHYLVGRSFGVGADSFSFGFGPELFGWTDKRGTRWKVSLIPLGGYVKFAGDADAVSRPGAEPLTPQEHARSFHTKPWWQRFLIVLAGPATNFIIAIVIFAGLFVALGIPRSPPVVGMVMPKSAAASIGLMPGDRIEAIGSTSITTFEDILQTVSLRPGEQLDIRFSRNGVEQVRPVRLGETERRDQFGQAARIGQLGIATSKLEWTHPPLLSIVPEATRYTFSVTRSMMTGLGQILTGERSVKEMGGTLKIAQVAGQQASLGAFQFIQLVALISINLGFINLLPVPMLDGGHLFFYLVEAVQRRPVSDRVQEWAFRGGLALILALLLFTTANDLNSFGVWARLGRLIG